MKAMFEKYTLSGAGKISALKYKKLHNLPHWHLEYELVFILHGSVELMINNSFYNLSGGECAFINTKDVHYIKGTSESIIGVIKTDAPYVKKITENNQLLSPVVKGDSLSVFEEIFSELKDKKAYSDVVSELIISRFVADIFRKNTTSPISQPQKQIKELKDLLEMLSNNYAHITFESAAAYLNLNESYFSKYFHRFAGMTFTRYLNILKVTSAIEKIHEKKMNMTEISISCGFGTIRNFNRVFKSLTGYSPTTLPDNFTFVYNLKDTDKNGFDPTLNCTEIIF